MKKWIVGLLLIAFVASETSCVVRANRPPRRHHRAPKAVVVY